MKRIYIIIIVLIVVGLISVIGVNFYNKIIGDNKISTVDSSPKPTLLSLSLRTDIPITYTNTFNGKFELIERTLYDTSQYIIYIHNDKARIDKNYRTTKKESYLLNLKTGEMIALNHQKKLYSSIPVVEEKPSLDSTFTVIKTNINKNILGQNCAQWRVKNRNDNTEITYWVSTNNYGFYYYLNKVWDASKKYHKYFQIIPQSFGFMPFEIVERNLLRDIKSSVNMTSISNQMLDTSLFTVPSDYKHFSN